MAAQMANQNIMPGQHGNAPGGAELQNANMANQ